MMVRTAARTIRYKSRLLHEIKLAEADDALINRRQAIRMDPVDALRCATA